MSINIKVRYRALMTHGLSYDIETRNTNLHSDRPHCPALGLIEDAPSCPPFSFVLASSLQSLDAHYQ